MIQVLNFPTEGRYLLDGNNTQITVISTNGAGYYFRAKIYIDDVLFDEQGWSRKDDFTAVKDLIYLYHAYFKPFFLGDFETGLLEQTNFKKKIGIVIEERLIADDSVVVTVTLPEFYLMYNVKSENFNDNNKLYILGLAPERMLNHSKGTIAIPFYVNAEDETVNVTVKDDLDNILHTTEILNVTGKKVYIYNLNLEEVTLVTTAIYVKAIVTVGTETIEKIYKLVKLPNFDFKEVVFQNNFGFYIPAYFDGDFEDTSGFGVQTYEQANNSLKVFAVDEEGTYTINTGNLSIKEKDIVNQVAQSLDCYFKNGDSYVQVNTGTKKATNFKSRLNIYTQDLQFSFRKGLPFTNDLTISFPGSLIPDIIAESVTLLSTEGISHPYIYNWQIDFSINFPIFQIFYQIRPNFSSSWFIPILLNNITSPGLYKTTVFRNYQIRLFANFNGAPIYSNILTVS